MIRPHGISMINLLEKNIRYIGSSLCFAVGLYFLICLLSFSPHDPSLYVSLYPAQSNFHNLGGILGAEISAHGVFQLGLGSSIFPLIFILSSIYIMKSKRLFFDLSRVVAMSFCMIFVIIYLAQLFKLPLRVEGVRFPAGGWFGEDLGALVDDTFGRGIFAVICFALCAPFFIHGQIPSLIFRWGAQRFHKSQNSLGEDFSYSIDAPDEKNLKSWSPSFLKLNKFSGLFSQWFRRSLSSYGFSRFLLFCFRKVSSRVLPTVLSRSGDVHKGQEKSFVDRALISDSLFSTRRDGREGFFPSGNNQELGLNNNMDSNQQVLRTDGSLPSNEQDFIGARSAYNRDGHSGTPSSTHSGTHSGIWQEASFFQQESIIHGDGSLAGDSHVVIVDHTYVFPDLNVFKRPSHLQATLVSSLELRKTDDLLVKTLSDFGIKAEIIGHQSGPVVTVYEVRPEAGVKQARLLGLSDDLALSLKSDSLLIQPIPEKSALGIQVPNPSRADVLMGELLDHITFSRLSSPLSFVIGKSISGQPVYADLGAMPHLLVAGSTGSGKSVGINTLITSMLARSSPKDVRMIPVDPKMLELSVYEGIPHLLMPVITQPEKATSALRWAVSEMERRYRIMQQMQVRNISAFNQAWMEASTLQKESVRLKVADETVDTLPHIVLVIDELADLMMTAPKEIESIIQRLAQKARASGIHMVLATQRPSVDIITGVIKANLPSRIAFQVVSKHDSRTILDQMGAEKLLGKGDLLLQRPGLSKLERIQGAYVSDSEVVAFVQSIKDKNQANYDQNLIDWVEKESSQDAEGDYSVGQSSDDVRWDDAIEIAKNQGQISASFLQRQLKIGYNRAARIVEQMEKMGLVGRADGAKPRKWLGQIGQHS